MNVRIMDTSVLLNILDIPDKNQNHKVIFKEFLDASKTETLILHLATIIETGNHISHIANGSIRRAKAILFADYLDKTSRGDAPWEYFGKELDKEDLAKIAKGFPTMASMCTGIGDMSIIRAYEKYKESVPAIGRIKIWSLDGHLEGYEEELVVPVRRRSR